MSRCVVQTRAVEFFIVVLIRAFVGTRVYAQVMNEVINDQTIYALSSGQGRAGVAVVRISGPQAFDVARSLGAKGLAARQAHLVKLMHPQTGQMLDHALVISFPKPASFTGEDVIELHVHGGRAVVAAVLDALSVIEHVRAARAGEFTERAFESGKLDLSQV
jgi:tRNA modification GTPase